MNIGQELWVSDGSPQNSHLLKDINSGSSDGVYRDGFGLQIAKISETLALFKGNDGSAGYELWKTDGTEEGTVLLKDIKGGTEGSDPNGFGVFDGVAYFYAKSDLENELWRSDGTTEGLSNC